MSQGDSAERWYQFEQHELMVRSFFVRARTLKEARQLVRRHPSGLNIGVPDYASIGPDYILIKGRGRLEPDQESADDRAAELEAQGGW